MQKPQAYFGFSKIGTTVNFKNLSLNDPTSYQWDFGDNLGNSTDKDPSYTYSQEGTYDVTLTVSDDDQNENSYKMTITVGVEGNAITIPLLKLVNQYIPSLILTEASTSEIIGLIQKWQLYLQPLVSIPHKVAEEDTHNETKWPSLVNYLIAQLVSYDVILQGANQFLRMANSETETENESGGEDTGIPITTEQQIKSIETGPAKTEWYENTSYKDRAEAMASLAKAYSSSMKVGGAMDQLNGSICQLAKRVRIYLPMCGQLEHSPTVPQVTTGKSKLHNANPFGITRRME